MACSGFKFTDMGQDMGQIIDDCKARLQFFQERLNYLADESSGLEYLRRVHERYLPKEIAETGNVRNEESAG
jgi:hypothetical protein